ncbi:MAG TPA: NADH-quinone oxidoreductase subunit C [Deinococcales bacterium]|nr:NADH-quinone oxidoreductase subunit C [Deinococcales bacterium]
MDSPVTLTVAQAEKVGFAAGRLDSGETVITVPAASLHGFLAAAQAAGFSMLTDLVGIDYVDYARQTPERFALVYRLVSAQPYEGLHVKVYLTDGQTLPTVTDLWGSANFMEREVFDLFGVVFEGHPDLRKILTPEDLDGHALRKDFPLGETPTLFRDGRFIDPAAFRAGLTGRDPGLTGYRGGNRREYRDDREPAVGRLDQEAAAARGGES